MSNPHPRRSSVLRRLAFVAIAGTLAVAAGDPGDNALEPLPEGQVLMDAMARELDRGMTLQLEGLEKAYFIQLDALDSTAMGASASYGAIIQRGDSRSRFLSSAVRIGSYELDNTNFDGGGFSFGAGGGFAQLPIDGDTRAFRHAVWIALDGAYKSGVETLTKKRAHMEDKTLEDRPNDYTLGEPLTHLDPVVSTECDLDEWEQRVETMSARFSAHPGIQDSSVSFSTAASQRYMVSSEGSRLRIGDTGATLSVRCETQSDDGMRFSDQLSYSSMTADGLPDVTEVVVDIDEMVARLEEVMNAEILDSYTGPVLFDAEPAALVVREMLASGIAGHVEPVGTERASTGGKGSLEKKLGQRILPRSFQVTDDPTLEQVGDTLLAGHYRFDDEGTPAQAVRLVTNGKLDTLVMSRVPTRKLTGTTGHGRRSSPFGNPEATIGCLLVTNDDSLPDEQMIGELIAAAEDEGLEYGIRIARLRSTESSRFSFFFGGGSGDIDLPDPLVAYRVYVEDGRQVPIRGCEFGPVSVRELRGILASGTEPGVHNSGDGGFGFGAPSSVVTPSLLFMELELVKIQQELDKLPLLSAPDQRG